jgi:hypothetical protein
MSSPHTIDEIQLSLLERRIQTGDKCLCLFEIVRAVMMISLKVSSHHDSLKIARVNPVWKLRSRAEPWVEDLLLSARILRIQTCHKALQTLCLGSPGWPPVRCIPPSDSRRLQERRVSSFLLAISIPLVPGELFTLFCVSPSTPRHSNPDVCAQISVPRGLLRPGQSVNDGDVPCSYHSPVWGR